MIAFFQNLYSEQLDGKRQSNPKRGHSIFFWSVKVLKSTSFVSYISFAYWIDPSSEPEVYKFFLGGLLDNITRLYRYKIVFEEALYEVWVYNTYFDWGNTEIITKGFDFRIYLWRTNHQEKATLDFCKKNFRLIWCRWFNWFNYLQTSKSIKYWLKHVTMTQKQHVCGSI